MELNPLQPGVAYLYPPESVRKPLDFLMFSGSIDKQHRAVIGLSIANNHFRIDVW